jgi:carbonic anhydrase
VRKGAKAAFNRIIDHVLCFLISFEVSFKQKNQSMRRIKIYAIPIMMMLMSICCTNKKSASEKPTAETAQPTNAAALTAEQVLAKLKSGNENFVKEMPARGHEHGQSYDYYDQVEHSKNDQHPIAFILSCIDSRVPPEIIFDQGIGELFVGRVAGNVEDQYILGSMEYAVNVKGVKLIVVLGHKNCGAIHAAFEHIDSSNEDLVPLVEHVREDVVSNDLAPYDASAKHNVIKTIGNIVKKSKALRSKVDAHELLIVGGLYDVNNGSIDWNTSNW